MYIDRWMYNALSQWVRRIIKKMRIIGLVMFVIGILLLVVWSQGFTVFLTPGLLIGGGGLVLIALSKQ